MSRSADYRDRTDESVETPPLGPRVTPVLEPNEARQGVTHHNVRYVLAAGLAGAVVILAVAYFVFF
jgi:hypothetical protein